MRIDRNDEPIAKMLQRKYPLHRVIIVSRSDVSFYIGAHRCKLPIVSIWYNLKRENLRQRLSTLAIRLKILLNSRGVVSQRRNERGIEHQVAFSPFPLFHSYVNRGAEREKEERYRGELQPRVDPSGTVKLSQYWSKHSHSPDYCLLVL